MKKVYVCLVLLFVSTCLLCAQAVLPAEILQKIGSSVFEVVVPKPKNDSLTYEKPLPFDRLPYMERVDKYRSIGTAFLLEDGLFYSAAHVFQLTDETANSEYYIRDAAGDVFAVDNFLKFSTARDFIVFTVKDFVPAKNAGLEPLEKVTLNTAIYAVGNAQGEGIVIRNGLLTSQTFENENGEWKWLRFSAAASPGNSGGPLITEDGKVIGIVTMKNRNENLNYALPLAELKNVPDSKGVVHRRVWYTLPNITFDKKYGVFDYTIDLPQPVTLVCASLTTEFKTWIKNLSGEFIAEFSFTGDKSFNKAKGYAEIMYDFYTPAFPCTIVLEEDNKWSMQYPGENNLKESKLPQNGSIVYGGMLNQTMVSITKPESLSVEDLIKSPKTYMDYILGAGRLYRVMGSERIAITSFGDPAKTASHVDSFGRTWLVSYWNLEFAEAMAVTFALPVPDGLFIMYKASTVDEILNGVNIDMAFMTDYVYAGYSGSVKDWKEFLSLDPAVYPLYEPFASMKLNVSEQETLFLGTDWTLKMPQNLVKINDETRLDLALGYVFENDRLNHEVRGFDFYSRPVTEDYVSVALQKKVRPPEGENRKLTDSWNAVENRRFPYTAVPYDQDQYTFYREVLSPQTAPENTADSLYVLSLELHGKQRLDDMRVLAEKIKPGLRIEVVK